MRALLFLILSPAAAFGWGEAGHHLVGRLAGKLVATHPEILAAASQPSTASFVEVFQEKRYMLGYLGNIPDSHWRNYDGGLKKEVSALGDPTHFLDTDLILGFDSPLGYAIKKVPLEYEAAKKIVKKDKPKKNFFKDVGSLPWRAQQFFELYEYSLANYPKQPCDSLAKKNQLPSREALAYAGILSHFTADAGMPLHSVSDYDGVSSGQKGLHWYFESDVVNSLEPGLEAKVEARARDLLGDGLKAFRGKTKAAYPDSESKNDVAALVLVLLAEGFDRVEGMKALDKKYALQTEEESNGRTDCDREGKKKRACRRKPDTLIEDKTVAQWFEPMIIERLALVTAVTADLWVRGWLKAKSPALCYTWDYALKPSFVSPTDANCFGYAMNEGLKWKSPARAKGKCVSF